MSDFKRFRPRRIDEETRRKYRETFLYPQDFILPVFLVSGQGIKKEIPSMPGIFHYSVDRLLPEIAEWNSLGLKSVLVFGVPEHKGIPQAYAPEGIVQQAVIQMKKHFPALEIITDVCLCSYSHDGHCFVEDNDTTISLLAQVALSHAQAGADVVAPSDMMDGRVWSIRSVLDEAGLSTPIMSYAAKYASAFYGPFREAADCAPSQGDRKTYQMDPANSLEAMEEIQADIDEGAVSVIIKPALSYLDVIRSARQSCNVPIIAYNVSGEYRMIQLMVENKLAKEELIQEVLVSIKRAGANRIISYWTPYILRKMNEKQF